MRISDWSSDVCSSDLLHALPPGKGGAYAQAPAAFNLASSCSQVIVFSSSVPFRKKLGVPVTPSSPPCCAMSTTACTFFWSERQALRSEEHTSELQSLMRISYAVF